MFVFGITTFQWSMLGISAGVLGLWLWLKRRDIFGGRASAPTSDGWSVVESVTVDDDLRVDVCKRVTVPNEVETNRKLIEQLIKTQGELNTKIADLEGKAKPPE